MGYGKTPAAWASAPPVHIRFTNLQKESEYSLREEVIAGLRRRPKFVSPKFLYDEAGSFLFDLICGLPEYYLTRAELSILRDRAHYILERLDGDVCLIELGAGACEKSRPLLETGRVSRFVPVDICDQFLRQSAQSLAEAFPGIIVHAVAMDFLDDLDRITPYLPLKGTRVIFLAGSSIGNFEPPEAGRLLSRFCGVIRHGDGVLIGFDLRKDPTVLHHAYNDSQNITAAFNLNLLSRLNRDLPAGFDPTAFRHKAFYNPSQGRIEMHLESVIRQEVGVNGTRILLEKGETIHTENSYKYTVHGFDALAASAGLDRAGLWTDHETLFAVGLYVPRR